MTRDDMRSARLRVDVKTDVSVMYRIGVWRLDRSAPSLSQKSEAEENLVRLKKDHNSAPWWTHDVTAGQR